MLERAKCDAEFAADVLKAVGENLPPEVQEACEKSIFDDEQLKKSTKLYDESGLANASPSQETQLSDDMPLGDGYVAVQSDGGDKIIVHETELPNHPVDGE